MTLRWEDPPAPKAGGRISGGYAHQAEADALRARPGRWAVLRSVPADQAKTLYNLAHTIRNGVRAAFRPTEEWEVAVRKVGTEVRLYIRYIGGPS